jgi:hypothetical protein
MGNHVLHGDTTISNGGLGSPHPYLTGVAIPTYVGATDPSDPGNSQWVDEVLSLRNLGKTRLPPTITYVGFSGSSIIYANSVETVRWTIAADNQLALCTLYVSLDSAKTWIMTKSLSTSIDTLSWTVPDTFAPQCYLKVAAVDDSGKTGSGLSSPFEIIKQLRIRQKQLSPASLGRPYRDTLFVETGVSPFIWRIVDKHLPASLYLDSLTGSITGIAYTTGPDTFTVSLTDAKLHTVQGTFIITVDSIIASQNIIVPSSDTFSANPGVAVSDTFILQNDTLRLTYSLFANRADLAPIRIDSLIDSIRLSNGKKAFAPRIPSSFFNDSVGSRAFFVVKNGSIVDTLPISHRIRRNANNCDNIGVGNLEWTPLSITAEPAKNDLPSVLACFDTPDGAWKYDKTKFRIIRWYPYFGNDTSDNKWVEGTPDFASIFKFDLGNLFWIKSNQTKTIDFGEAITPPLTVAVPETLNAAQWTDFSVPFNFPILIQDIINTTKQMTALDRSLVDAIELYKWEKTGKTWVATLIHALGFDGEDTVYGGAGKAYTAYNPNAKNTLQIPPICAAMSSTALAKRTASKANVSWNARLNFRSEDGNGLNPVFVGYNSNASLPVYLPSPPSFSDMTVKVFDRQSRKTFGHAFVHDLSGGGIGCEFILDNKTSSSERITGFVGKRSMVPAGYVARFFDPESGSKTGQEDSISISIPANSKKFMYLALGSNDFVLNFNRMLLQYKTQFASVYPNPCTRKLTIGFSLPYMIDDIRWVNFAIFDLRGRVIWSRKLNNGLHPGINSIVFERNNNLGGQVSSGIYVIRMAVAHANSKGNEVFQRSVSLID